MVQPTPQGRTDAMELGVGQPGESEEFIGHLLGHMERLQDPINIETGRRHPTGLDLAYFALAHSGAGSQTTTRQAGVSRSRRRAFAKSKRRLPSSSGSIN